MRPPPRPRLLVCVGEASGDRLAADVLRTLHARGIVPQTRGIPGPALRDLGVAAAVQAEEVGAVGIVEALGAARRAPRALSAVRALVDGWRPDLVWTVDNPGLNLRIGRMARRRGHPVVHLVSPQVWAWRPGRVHRVGEAADLVLCLLPFEPSWYAGTGVRAVFTGHPAAAPLAAGPRLRRPGEAPVVALLPGSRPSEIAALWPVFRATTARLHRRCPQVRFRIAVAPTVDPAVLAGVVGERCAGAREALAGAHVALCTAGTATLECAAAAVPFVATYRVHPLTWAIGRRLARIRHLALPNLVAGRALAPEHLQDLDPDALADDLLRLAGPEGEWAGAALRAVARTLHGEGALERMAGEIATALARGPQYRGSQHRTSP